MDSNKGTGPSPDEHSSPADPPELPTPLCQQPALQFQAAASAAPGEKSFTSAGEEQSARKEKLASEAKPAGETRSVELAARLLNVVIDSKYRIESYIGRGGMGTVWKADHLMLHRPVAIKLLRRDDETAPSEESLKRFHREAAVASRLHHDNTVLLYDFGVFEGMPYLAMEYLLGETLRARMRREGKISPFKAAAWCAQIAEGLQEAHNLGILHRDLKPENVMLVKRGAQPEQAVVLDFGVAKLLDGTDSAGGTLTENGAVVGTPNYMSPEQIRGEKIRYTADVYSLGIILYEMLTGAVPFSGDSALSIALKHLNEQPGSVREALREYPFAEEVDQILKKALAKKVDERFATPIEVSDAITRALAPYSPTVVSAPDSTASRRSGLRRERRFAFPPSLSGIRAYGAAAILVGCLAGGAYSMSRSSSGPARDTEETSPGQHAAVSSRASLAQSPAADPQVELDTLKERAHALAQEGQLTAALTAYRELLKKIPDDPLILGRTGAVLLSLEAASAKEITEASELIRRALQLEPQNLENRIHYGHLLLTEKRNDDSVAVFRQLLKQKPGDPMILTELGKSLLAAGRVDEAVTQLRVALRSDPKRASTSFAIAEAYVKLKRFPLAAESCRVGLENDPMNVRALTRCGEILERMGRRKLALSLYNRALEIAPGDLQAATGKSRLRASGK